MFCGIGFLDRINNSVDQYQPKPKRPYTGPPRPNLMKHDVDIKRIAQQVSDLSHSLEITQAENRRLRSKINQLEFELKNLSPVRSRFRY